MDGLLTIKEAARFLACNEATLRKWIHQGRLSRMKGSGLDFYDSTILSEGVSGIDSLASLNPSRRTG